MARVPKSEWERSLVIPFESAILLTIVLANYQLSVSQSTRVLDKELHRVLEPSAALRREDCQKTDKNFCVADTCRQV